MINQFAKLLVLLQAVLSIAGMAWAIMIVLQSRDFGWKVPYKEVLEWTSDGTPKTSVLHASEYDKSFAAAKEAEKTRDRTYAHVKPAIDSIRATEPYLANNHLFYLAELRRLHEATDKIEVKRLKDGGNTLDTPDSSLGKPVMEDKALDSVTKSYTVYQADLAKLIGHVDPETKKVTLGEIDAVEEQIRKIVSDTKKITAELTGTDEFGDKIGYGLYQLTDLEFKYQAQIKIETDDIKPNWSKAVEQSRVLRYRRTDLEATLEKLKAPMPPPPKDNKKL
jgi:hypothetical protein